MGRADRIRSRSPSPSSPGTFQFPPSAAAPKRSASDIQEEQFRDALSLSIPARNDPPTTGMATPEQIAAIRDQLRSEIRAEFRSEAAAAAASIPDAIRRKPDIPTFDKQHIEIWLKRTSNAFIRAGITSAAEKFAFLETKFPVGGDARIDEFLYGRGTAEDWNNFVAYLKAEYGPTKQQRASVFIDGFKREGRKPSQYAATLDEKTKDVTVDDIKKEMLLREMPVDVRRMLQERIEGMTFKEAAKVADSYFDAEGRAPPSESSNCYSKRNL